MLKSTRAISILAVAACFAAACRGAAPLQDPPPSDKTSAQAGRNYGPDSDMRTAIRTGKMRTLLMDGILKARTGVTTLAEVIRATATMV